MRVLHLIDAVSPWGGPCTQHLAAQTIVRLHEQGWEQHDVLLIGTRADVREAARCGLAANGSIWPLGGRRGRTLSAVGGLRKWLLAARRAGALPSVIHAWSASAGAIAAMAAGELPRVVTPKPLAVDCDAAAMVDRKSVRERWHRDEGIAPEEFVLGFLGEPVDRFDSRAAMHVGARTGLSTRRVRMIMSGRALGRPEQERFLSRLGLDRTIVQDEGITRPWEVLRGLDAALILAPVTGREGSKGASLSSLPALMAQAAGVPIIAEANAPLDGLIVHERTGLIFPVGDLNIGCERLVRLHDDRAIASSMCEAAREQAAGRFGIEAFCGKLDDAYRRAIDERRAAYLDMAQPGELAANPA